MDEPNDRMYVFDLVGTAFLYHQVRHIMAALFLVGSGFEQPQIIAELMNIEEGAEPVQEEDKTYSVVGSKPDYQMADDLPLMLWECGFDESELDWRTSELDERKSGSTARGDLHHQVQSIYIRSRISAALDQHFLRAVEMHHPPSPKSIILKKPDAKDNGREGVINMPLGGGVSKRLQKYKPLLERTRLDVVEVMNERWRLGKGSRREEKRRVAGNENDDGLGVVRAKAALA
jgi:tRNA pseudouridine38/39 synthase